MNVRVTHWGYAVDKEKWGDVRTEYVFDLGGVPNWRNNREQIEQLFLFHRYWQKAGFHTRMITCVPESGQGQGGSAPEGWTFFFSQRYRNGDRPIHGEMFYKDKLVLTKFPFSGRVSHIMLTGCLDSEDIHRGKDGSTYLRPTYQDLEYLRGIAENPLHIMNRVMVNQSVRIGNVILANYVPTRRIQFQGVSHLHASTRWRGVVEGQTVDMGKKIIGTLALMAEQWEKNQGRLDEVPEFHYADTFEPTIAALNGVHALASGIKSWIDDNQWEDDKEPPDPRGRWGITSASIEEAWTAKGDMFQQQIPELLKVHRPFTDPNGFDFIKNVDLQPYQDLLQEAIAGLSFSVGFDWYNPYSYPDQEPEDGYEFQPDILALRM